MIGKPSKDLTLRLIKSRRLSLIAATPELIEKDIKGRDFLSEALGVSIPETWPPELYGPRAKQFALTQLDDVSEQGWSFWYLLTNDDPCELVGICGFKGRPDESGSVEIAYSILSDFQRRGFCLRSGCKTGRLGIFTSQCQRGLCRNPAASRPVHSRPSEKWF